MRARIQREEFDVSVLDPLTDAVDGELRDEAGTVLRTLSSLVEPLAAIIPGDCEVVLHDLRLLPNSIVALAGCVTGRTIGGPATDLLLRGSAQKHLESRIGYVSRAPDGRELLSSTLIFRTSAGEPVAALCINCDTRYWRILADLAAAMLPFSASEPVPDPDGNEHFMPDVDNLADDLLARAIATVEVPVDLMQKRHKLGVVQDLKERGFFILRESVERAARALGVSRFTIYNYLKELDQADAS